MPISVEIKNLAKLNAVADGMPRLKIGLKGQVHQAAYDFANRLIRRAKLAVTKGGASGLVVRTGRLRASINARVEEFGDTLNVTLGANTVYARIHEEGGITRPHIIAPKRGGVLTGWTFKGKTVFARYVFHPGSRIPARPYLRPSVEQEMPAFRERLARMLGEVAREGIKAA